MSESLNIYAESYQHNFLSTPHTAKRKFMDKNERYQLIVHIGPQTKISSDVLTVLLLVYIPRV